MVCDTHPVHPVLAVNRVSGRWPVALKAAIAVAGPVAVTALLGDATIGLMMGLGAFTVLFGPMTAGAFRIRLNAVVAAGLTAAAALGVLTHPWPWLNLLAMAVVAVLSSTVCVALKVGPPGAYFFVLVCGVAGFMAQHGQPGLRVVGLTALGGVVATVVGLLDLTWAPRGPETKALTAARAALERFETSDDAEARALASQSLHHAWTTLRDGRGAPALTADLADLQARYEQRSATLSSTDGFEVHPWGSPEGEERPDDSPLAGFDAEQLRDSSLGRPGPLYLLRRAYAWPSEVLLLGARVGAAALLTGLISLLTPMAHPYWTVAFAVLVLHQGGSVGAQTVRGIQRMLGTAAGLVLYAGIVAWSPEGLWVAALLFVLQFLIELLVVRNYAAAVTFITPLALTIASASGSQEEPATVILERLSDSLIGVGVALLALSLIGRGTGLLLARAHARRAVVAMGPVLDALAEGRVSTQEAAEERRRLYFELLELQHGLGESLSNEPTRVAPYRETLARVAELGYLILGSCWQPPAAHSRRAAVDAKRALAKITAHPVSAHRHPFEIGDDVAEAIGALGRWERRSDR